MKGQIVVSTLERRGRRQDDVRVPGRFVDIEIDRHHELKAGERPIQLTAVRRRQHGVPGRSYQSLNLSRTFGQNLFSKRDDRKLSGKFR